MELKCLKRELILFFKAYYNWSLMGLSNEALCILVAQGAAKLPEDKVTKKSETQTQAALE